MKDTKKATSGPASALRDLPPGSRLSKEGTTTVAPLLISADAAASAPAVTLPPAPPLPSQPLLAPHHFPKAQPSHVAAPQNARPHRPTFDEPPAHIAAWRENARNLRRTMGEMLHSLERGIPSAQHFLGMAEGNAELAAVFSAEGLNLQEAAEFVNGALALVQALDPKEPEAPESPPTSA